VPLESLDIWGYFSRKFYLQRIYINLFFSYLLDKEQNETPYSRNNCMAFYNLRIKTLLYYVQINMRLQQIGKGIHLLPLII